LNIPILSLILLGAINLLNYLDRYIVAGVLTPLKIDMALTDEQLGRLATAFMIGYFITSPVFGYLGDRYPRRKIIAFGIAIWSFCTLLTGWAQTFTWLIAFRIFIGIGEASYATLSPSWIADLFDAKKRNTYLTLFYAAMPVGAALGYLVGGLVSAHWGWRYAFIWAGVPGLILAVIILFLREPTRGAKDPDDVSIHHRLKLSDLSALFSLKNYQLITWGYVAYTFSMGAFGYWGPTFLCRVHHVSNDQASLFFGSILVVMGLVGTLLGGWFGNILQRRSSSGYAQLLAWSVLASVPVVFVAFLASNIILCMTCLAIAMLLLFFSAGPVNTLILETVPVAIRASAMALSIFLIHLFGDFWSPEIIGWLSDTWHSLHKAVFVLPLALAISGVIWLVLVKEMKRHDA
jgi:MFS family permease